MCTLTYLPLYNGFIFTGNRDESVERKAAIPPKEYEVNQQNIVFPKDGEAGGTWMAAAKNLTACLLNGGFEKHLSQPPYRKSRGLVLLDLFAYSSPKNFTKEYDFAGIEPFTIVAVADDNIHEIRWDGSNIYYTALQKDKPKIWSSAQLYLPEVRQQREEWFNQWLQDQNSFELEEILQFHRFKGAEGTDEEKIIIDRGFLKTVSISSISINGSSGSFLYHDLLSEEQTEAFL